MVPEGEIFKPLSEEGEGNFAACEKFLYSGKKLTTMGAN
jgi:hypothetical protein